MQTFGIVGQPNVTVTTFSSDHDRAESSRINDVEPKVALDGVTFKNMRSRFAKQGAEETRYFPIN